MKKAVLAFTLLSLLPARPSTGEVVLEAEKMFRNQIKVTSGGTDGLCILEQSTNLLSFSPIQLFSGPTMVGSTQHFAIFRAETVSPLAASYCQRAAIDSPLTAL